MLATSFLIAVIVLNAASLGVGVWTRRRMRRAIAKAQEQWEEAKRAAEVAQTQARVIGECGELMCDDCRAIVHGHYMRHAYPSVARLVREMEDAE